jgi:UDP-N-acetyl-D-mannosaminuronic acid dehydrogenase
VKKLLELECKRVLCTDELARGPWYAPLEQVLAESDALIIAAPHTSYRKLDPKQPTLDPWNLLGRGGLLK